MVNKQALPKMHETVCLARVREQSLIVYKEGGY